MWILWHPWHPCGCTTKPWLKSAQELPVCIHPIENFIRMNLFKILWVVTRAELFLTCEVMELLETRNTPWRPKLAWISWFIETRLKCKSSARVKLVLKKDWMVKKCWKKCLKKIEMSKNFFWKNRKKSEKIRKNQKKSKKNNQK